MKYAGRTYDPSIFLFRLLTTAVERREKMKSPGMEVPSWSVYLGSALEESATLLKSSVIMVVIISCLGQYIYE